MLKRTAGRSITGTADRHPAGRLSNARGRRFEMSIAIHSSRAARAEQAAEGAAVERRRDPSSESRAPERSADPKAPTGRQALASALSEALGLSGTTGAAA